MNAEAKVKADKPNPNLKIWSALAKTDPAQTKAFNRAGGFKGTAIKPIWVIRRLTEEFGPCGVGWGIGEPQFQVVPCDGETMVYCTVECWHNNGVAGANPVATLYGVGGDKVMAKRSSGPFCDDEAFKKAFTDAVNNAFKFIGVAADIHMGQFDDNKYVAAMREEFSDGAGDAERKKPVKLDGPYTSKTALWTAVKAFDRTLRGISDSDELEPYLQTEEVLQLLAQCERDAPQLLETGEGLPPEYVPLNELIKQRRKELATDETWRTNPVFAG